MTLWDTYAWRQAVRWWCWRARLVSTRHTSSGALRRQRSAGTRVWPARPCIGPASDHVDQPSSGPWSPAARRSRYAGRRVGRGGRTPTVRRRHIARCLDDHPCRRDFAAVRLPSPSDRLTSSRQTVPTWSYCCLSTKDFPRNLLSRTSNKHWRLWNSLSDSLRDSVLTLAEETELGDLITRLLKLAGEYD